MVEAAATEPQRWQLYRERARHLIEQHFDAAVQLRRLAEIIECC
jgi:hypothetical protein